MQLTLTKEMLNFLSDEDDDSDDMDLLKQLDEDDDEEGNYHLIICSESYTKHFEVGKKPTNCSEK